MALTIKNAEVERLATEVARLTGETKTQAIRVALEERRRRLHAGIDPQHMRPNSFWLTVWSQILSGASRATARQGARRRYHRLRARRRPGVVNVIVDSSALVAIVMAEPTGAELFKTLARAPSSVSARRRCWSRHVLNGRLATGRFAAQAVRLVARLEIEVLPFSPEHWPVAWAAFLRFGKGRHAASLNLGDCLTYAVAKLARRPLLCVGDGFPQTDLELVPLPA